MKVGVPKEVVPNERRVALTPDALPALVKCGLEILIEAGAGEGAFFADADYQRAGGKTVPAAEVFSSDVVVKLHKPTLSEIDAMRAGAGLISFLFPASNPGLVKSLADRKV